MSALRLRTIGPVLLAGLLVIALTFEGYRWYEVRNYNESLKRGDLTTAAAHASPYGEIARAYRLQMEGEMQDAISAYSRVATQGNEPLQRVARFNLATLYLDAAISAQRNDDVELATPLFEMAKENYREVLRANSDAWDARYNLARALERLPDPVDVPVDDEVNPERSPRAPQATRGYEQLP